MSACCIWAMNSCGTDFPFVDLNGGGSVQGMIAACEKAIADGAGGHEGGSWTWGPFGRLRICKAYTKMMKDTTAVSCRQR